MDQQKFDQFMQSVAGIVRGSHPELRPMVVVMAKRSGKGIMLFTWDRSVTDVPSYLQFAARQFKRQSEQMEWDELEGAVYPDRKEPLKDDEVDEKQEARS